MQYDPIKRSLGKVFNRSTCYRKIFYKLLDMLLLRSWHIRKELRRWNAPENPVILDAGSGFGQYSYRMARMFPGALIKAVDIKDEQIQDCNSFFLKSKLNNRVIFENADLTKHIEADQYDLVLSVDVMEHIEDDISVFKNFYASLKKKGILIVSTPSDKGGSDSHEHEEGSGFIDEHVRDGYNIDEIRNKLHEAGFLNINARYQYGKSGHISWLISMKYPIQMIGASKIFYLIIPFYYLITFPIAAFLNWIDLIKVHKTGTGLIVTAIK